MTATEETPELQASLGDTLAMVAKLGAVRRLGLEWRRLALALSNTAPDIACMDGLVIEGEVYAARWRQEYAVCHCGNNLHEYRRDWPRGRGHWHTTKREAQAMLKQAQDQRASWEPRRPEPHLVSHLVATTATETVT
jgi:hypothetical protein